MLQRPVQDDRAGGAVMLDVRSTNDGRAGARKVRLVWPSPATRWRSLPSRAGEVRGPYAALLCGCCSPDKYARNCRRARCTRLFSVPIAQPVRSAASS